MKILRAVILCFFLSVIFSSCGVLKSWFVDSVKAGNGFIEDLNLLMSAQKESVIFSGDVSFEYLLRFSENLDYSLLSPKVIEFGKKYIYVPEGMSRDSQEYFFALSLLSCVAHSYDNAIFLGAEKVLLQEGWHTDKSVFGGKPDYLDLSIVVQSIWSKELSNPEMGKTVWWPLLLIEDSFYMFTLTGNIMSSEEIPVFPFFLPEV